MWDSWGDGWNGNTLEFYDQAGENQVPNTGSYFVLPSERKNAANREVCLPNQCFSIVVGGGSYTNEISWRIRDSDENVVLTGENVQVAGTGELLCTSCPQGKSTASSLKCEDCPAGKNAPNINGSCEVCGSGKYNEEAGQSSCKTCPGGTFISDNKQQAHLHNSAEDCTSCSTGTRSGSGASECLTCGTNTYQNEPGQTTCKNCPSGKFATKTSKDDHDDIDDCDVCDAGKFVNSANECENCAVGKYTSSDSQTSCSSCETGKYSGVAGQTSCADCQSGKYAAIASSAGGSGVSMGATKCESCPTGKFAADVGSRNCNDCTAGKYAAETSSSSCTSCPQAKVSVSSASTCNFCDTGKYVSNNQCLDCAPGYVRPEPEATTGIYGSGCTPCPQNEYDPGTSEVCEDCADGKSAPLGSSVCSVVCETAKNTYKNPNAEDDVCGCRAGYGKSSLDPEGCAACPLNTFSNEFTGLAVDCTPCSVKLLNSKTVQVGSNSEEECVCEESFVKFTNTDNQQECGCPAGEYKEGNSCVRCVDGYYKSSEGNDACTSCGTGFTTGGNIGSTSEDACTCKFSFVEDASTCVCDVGFGLTEAGDGCASCVAGKYSNTKSLDSCTECPQGTFSNVVAASSATTCEVCSAGKWSAATGASDPASCTDCANGKFLVSSENVGSEHASEANCISCPHGTYGSGAGASSCSVCESGKYQNKTGRVGVASCFDCEEGKYGTEPGAISVGFCFPCPAGTWSNKTGAGLASACNICGAGKYSEYQGARNPATCQECLPGKFLSDAGTDVYLHDGRNDCTNCPMGEYSQEAGSYSCTKCPAATYNPVVEGNSLESCIKCPPGSFAEENRLGQFSASTCIMCPKGTYQPYFNFSGTGCQNCETGKTTYPPESFVFNSSISLYEMNHFDWHTDKASCNISTPGFWINDLSGKVMDCPSKEKGCGEGNKCNPGYVEDLCAACDAYYYQSGDGCLECKTSKLHWMPHLILVSIILCLGMIWGLNLKGIQQKTDRHFSKITPRLWKISAKVFAEHYDSVASKSKIAFSFYQVTLLMGQVYVVEYPPTYQAFEANFDWLGFNLMMEIDCYQKITFFTRLVGTTLGPLLFVIIMFIFGWISVQTTKQQAKKEARKSMVMKGILMVSFVFLPSASFVVFQSFSCGEDNLLSADPAVNCESTEYSLIVLYALVMLFIWPIGVPFYYLYVLGKHYGPSADEMQETVNRWLSGQFGLKEEEQAKMEERYMLLEEQAPPYLRVLNAEFEAPCWWVPVFEQYRKLAITGVTILFGAGTVDQLIVGMIIAILAALVYFAVQPYKNFGDDLFSMVSHFQIVLVLLWSLLVKFNKRLEEAGEVMSETLDADILGYLLIMTNLSVIFFFVIFMFIEYRSVTKSVRARSKWDILNRKGVRANSVVNQMRRMSGASDPPPSPLPNQGTYSKHANSVGAANMKNFGRQQSRGGGGSRGGGAPGRTGSPRRSSAGRGGSAPQPRRPSTLTEKQLVEERGLPPQSKPPPKVAPPRPPTPPSSDEGGEFEMGVREGGRFKDEDEEAEEYY
ncbi:hypothetical protein TrVE_jg5000 [Triparma verrucosa]|uniref:Tyrosine-protein kinase ephrin type A/B receptor-like domain-containing protein n=1 Tax=Triparma verrucosa TaxID=1606542 RepID=A0A9W7CN51_9STRA|nr:hypothetical protein TrVE_jg5000 [Triparma verrucosa]